MSDLVDTVNRSQRPEVKMNQEAVLLEWSSGPPIFTLLASLESKGWLLIEDVTVPGLPQREAGVADSARQGWGCSWRRIVSWRWNRARTRVPLPWVIDYCLESRSFNMHVIFQTGRLIVQPESCCPSGALPPDSRSGSGRCCSLLPPRPHMSVLSLHSWVVRLPRVSFCVYLPCRQF